MTRWKIAIAATADEQIQAIGRWWQVNRQDAPALFTHEFAEALDRLAATPLSGATYLAPRPEETRRILLPRTRYHVYYTVSPGRRLVIVRAVWHAARARGPKLG